MWAGIIACFVAALCLGSVFVPLKKFPASDGVMAQFFMSLGGFLISLAIHACLNFPPIFPLAMLGGSFWCIANACAVVLMNRLGMALGFLIWNSVSCLTGWATSRFGLFGVPTVVPHSALLNYIGVVVLLAGSVIYLFIKSKVEVETTSSSTLPSDQEKGTIENANSANSSDQISMKVRLIALVGAVICGLFYGSMCTPVTYLQNVDGNPVEGLPYLFSFFCGIMPTSTAILAVYSMFKKNVPDMPPYLVLPGLLCGVLFGFGMGGFFIGNEQLSQTVAYPICCFAPATVISIWSVFCFREITGKKNLLLLAVAYVFTAIGLIMVTVSNSL